MITWKKSIFEYILYLTISYFYKLNLVSQLVPLGGSNRL